MSTPAAELRTTASLIQGLASRPRAPRAAVGQHDPPRPLRPIIRHTRRAVAKGPAHHLPSQSPRRQQWRQVRRRHTHTTHRLNSRPTEFQGASYRFTHRKGQYFEHSYLVLVIRFQPASATIAPGRMCGDSAGTHVRHTSMSAILDQVSRSDYRAATLAGTIPKHCLCPEQMFLNGLDAYHAKLIDSKKVDPQLDFNGYLQRKIGFICVILFYGISMVPFSG